MDNLKKTLILALGAFLAGYVGYVYAIETERANTTAYKILKRNHGSGERTEQLNNQFAQECVYLIDRGKVLKAMDRYFVRLLEFTQSGYNRIANFNNTKVSEYKIALFLENYIDAFEKAEPEELKKVITDLRCLLSETERGVKIYTEGLACQQKLLQQRKYILTKLSEIHNKKVVLQK